VPAPLDLQIPDPTVFCVRDEEAASEAPSLAPLCWAGLAWLPPNLAGALPDELDHREMGSWLVDRAHAGGAVRAVHARLTTRTARDWLRAQRAALEGEVPGLLLGGRQVRPGVWLSRNCALHADARLVAPAWVGEDTRVERGAVVGPGAVVGAGSIVDAGAHVEGALVLPGTYLGESIELRDAVADRGLVTHARIGATVPIRDPFMVGGTRPDPGKRPGVGPVQRLLATILLLAGAPLLLLARLWRLVTGGSGFAPMECARLPAPPHEPLATFRLWRLSGAGSHGTSPSLADLLGRVVPGLWSVLRGDLRLVGVTPRDPDALGAMPPDWRDACARSHAGLVTEPLVLLDTSASEDERAAADACYATTRSARRDAWLFLRYLRGTLLTTTRSAPAALGGREAGTEPGLLDGPSPSKLKRTLSL
jgi:hypothetical protein